MRVRKALGSRCGDFALRHAYDPVRRDREASARPATIRPVSLEMSEDAFNELRSSLKNQMQLVAVVGRMIALRAIAAELFLGDIQVNLECDPEIENAMCVVFRVQADGELSEIAERRREWYRRTFGLLGLSSSKLRLSIDIH
jgi:hypothetical protein